MAGPIDRFGTKCPSMTSTWMRSAPARSASATCSPRRAKSAARIEGASRTRCFRSGGTGLPESPVATDETVRRRVVAELWLGLALELGDDSLGQLLAQLDDPLVERVDVPDGALREDAVLVQRDELAERRRRKTIDQDRVGGPVAVEHPVRHEPIRSSLGLDLLGRLSER